MGLKLGSDPSFIKSQVCAVELLEEMEINGLRLSLIQLLQQDIAGFRSVPKSRSYSSQETASQLHPSLKYQLDSGVIVMLLSL